MAEPGYVCFCNKVTEEPILDAVRTGAQNLAQIYDRTGAGTGPCGGSCRERIKALIALGQGKPPPSRPWPDEVVRALSLFNRRYYWETHEVLEALWLEETGSRRTFYQGIIQAAASLYHVLNANPRGVIKLARDSRAKLAPFSPSYEGIAIRSVLEALDLYIRQSEEILGGTLSGFNYDLLPHLTLGDDMQVPR
jgi:bacterioferritin-associated ferredoxin